MTCSHHYRDVRFINQLVYNWDVSPTIDRRPEMNDGQPRREMQYGQKYKCIDCGETCEPERAV